MRSRILRAIVLVQSMLAAGAWLFLAYTVASDKILCLSLNGKVEKDLIACIPIEAEIPVG